MKRRTLQGGSAATLLDPARPEGLHLINRKLNYTMDDRPVFWFINAVGKGLKDYALTPFRNMHVGIAYKVREHR